jgi:hypothetical protein
VALGKLKNINRDGLFIQSEYGDIAVHQTLEIELLSPPGQCLGSGRFQSIVVHKSNGGFGVEIADEGNSDHYDAIMKLIESGTAGGLVRYA